MCGEACLFKTFVGVCVCGMCELMCVRVRWWWLGKGASRRGLESVDGKCLKRESVCEWDARQ